MKSVTVLIAVKNKVGTIEACLESVLSVSYPVHRIMVLDGFSNDGTYEVLRRFAGKVEVHQLRANLSGTFNWALDRVDTEFVAFTDADCVVSPDWLDHLLAPFEKDGGLVGAAGYCGTPQGLSALQTMIGMELESRFKRFPKYITRAPTMNLCVRTEVARKTRFDEEQLVAVETDFGYRLSSLGRIRYVHEAKVWHYHRASWPAYFRQQRDQARWAVRVVSKHRAKALGDHISTGSMVAQIPLLGLFLAGIPLSLLDARLAVVSGLFLLTLLIIYKGGIQRAEAHAGQTALFLVFFVFRNFAWLVGAVEGLIGLVASSGHRGIHSSGHVEEGRN